MIAEAVAANPLFKKPHHNLGQTDFGRWTLDLEVMKNKLHPAFDAYRQYRAVMRRSKVYQTIRYVLVSATLAYVLLLCFP